MILIKIKNKTESAAAEYITEDHRYYIRKHKPGKGWDVFKIDKDNHYKFYRVFPSLQEVRELP